MSNCAHETYVPVYVTNTPDEPNRDVRVPVAHLCVDCREQLPAWWGCEDCTIAEGNRKVSEMVPKMYLTRACRRHQEAL